MEKIYNIKGQKNIVIRDAVIEDYVAIEALMEDLHSKHVEERGDSFIPIKCLYTVEEYKKLINNLEYIVIVAVDENESVIGVCITSIRGKSNMVSKKIAYIEALCVAKNMQRKFIGKRLFEENEKRIRTMKISRIDLMVWNFNKDAISFYQSIGMKVQRCILEKELIN